MSSKGDLTKGTQHHAKDAAQRAGPWMERLARSGYATEGAVYSLIGLLAAGAAFSSPFLEPEAAVCAPSVQTALAREGLVGRQGDILNRLCGLPLRGTFGEDDDVVFLTRLATLLRKHYPGV